MCSLRDAGNQWAEHNATVFGISLDDVATLQKFAEAQELPFPLLSDVDGSVAQKYGVLYDKRPMAKRVTFVIDPKGVLRHVTQRVDVRAHGEQMLEILTKLQEKDRDGG